MTLWFFEKALPGLETWCLRWAVLFLGPRFVFFSEEPTSGLCIRHPATDPLRRPQPAPQIAASNCTRRTPQRPGKGWQEEERMSLFTGLQTEVCEQDVSPLCRAVIAATPPPTSLHQNPLFPVEGDKPRHLLGLCPSSGLV